MMLEKLPANVKEDVQPIALVFWKNSTCQSGSIKEIYKAFWISLPILEPEFVHCQHSVCCDAVIAEKQSRAFRAAHDELASVSRE